MPEEILIFANPIAGRGRGQIVARRLAIDCESAGYKVTTIFQKPIDVQLPMLNRNAVAAISIGGDGTLRAVVDLLYANGGTSPPLLPVPMGTANLMGRHLGVHWSMRNLGPAVLTSIRQNKIIHLDAGRANGKIFLLMAGVGIDANVVHILDRMRKGPIDFSSYVLPAALTFANYEFPAITLTVDSKTILNDVPAVAVIGNVKEYGTGFPILIHAIPDDGLLDVCAIPCRDRRELAEILMLVTTGEHSLREGVVYTRGKQINVTARTAVPVQVDGDSAGHTPVTIDLLPTSVPFLSPA